MLISPVLVRLRQQDPWTHWPADLDYLAISRASRDHISKIKVNSYQEIKPVIYFCLPLHVHEHPCTFTHVHTYMYIYTSKHTHYQHETLDATCGQQREVSLGTEAKLSP